MANGMRGAAVLLGIGVNLAVAAPQRAAAQTTPFLPVAVYEAEIHAYGTRYGNGLSNDIFQIANDPYAGFGNHYGTGAASSWEVENERVTYCCTLATHATAQTSDAGGGSAKVSVSSTNDEADAWARMTYWFTIIGPDVPYVDVTISGYGNASANSEQGPEYAMASFNVLYKDTTTGLYAEKTEAFGNNERGAFSTTIRIKPNISYYQGAPRIILTAAASVGYQNASPRDIGVGGQGEAYIDPIFTITDPALRSQYSFVGIPFDATAPVPEPAAWALMIGGFGAIGWAARRRRTRVALRYA